jgi:alkyl hydroperoxide reductase subunit AhpC
MPAYNQVLDKFAGYDAQVVGISVDSIYSHIAWQQKEIGLLKFPLVSDFYPHGGVAQKYGILREVDPLPGISERAIFIVDKGGKIAFAKVYHLGEQPPHEDCFEVLRQLQERDAA